MPQKLSADEVEALREAVKGKRQTKKEPYVQIYIINVLHVSSYLDFLQGHTRSNTFSNRTNTDDCLTSLSLYLCGISLLLRLGLI